jgi:DNA-binding CsgD family transcriptional regulator
MAALRALLDAGGGVAIVSGEAGIGKSRLVREFAAEAAERGRVVLWGRPEEVAQPGPFALIVDLLESIAEVGGSGVKTACRELGAILVRPADSGGGGPAPSARGVAAEIRGLLSQLERPPLLVLEDLHWADEPSHAVLLHLGRASKDDAHILVMTYRSEMLEGAPSLARLIDSFERERVDEAINLPPLNESEVSEMLNVMIPQEFAEDARARIALLGEGIPFFIEELADAAALGVVPRSVELTVNHRLQGMEPEASETIRAASLLVGAIEPRVLGATVRLDVDAVSRHLLQGARSGLLADREGRLVFRHSLVRDAIANAVVSVQRAEFHQRIARAIEDVFAADLEAQGAALSHHWEQAGDPGRAADAHLMAGARALALAATADARAHFAAASEWPSTHVEGLRGLAEVEFREGNEDEAVRLFRAVADDLIAIGDLRGAARSLSRLAWALRNRESSEQVFRTLDEALDLLKEEEDGRDYVEVLVQKGQILSFHFGRFVEAKPILLRATRLATTHSDKALVAQSYDGLAQVADAEGNAAEALELGEAAMSAARESASAEIMGRTYNNHAIKLASFGRPEAALVLLDDIRNHLLKTYGSAGVSVIDVSRAWIKWLMGLPNEVAILTALGQAAWQRWRGYRRILEVWTAVEFGQVSQAEERIASAWIDLGGILLREQFLTDSTGSGYETRQVIYAEALLLIHADQFARAVQFARSVAAFDRESFGESFDVGQGLVLLATAHLFSEDLSEGNQAIEELDTLLAPVERYPYLHAHLLELRGMASSIKGDHEAASGFFEEAAEVFGSCANESDRARCERQAAEAFLQSDKNDRERALDHLRRGLALAENAGATAEKNHIEAALRELGVRPRAGRPRRTDKTSLTPREAEVAVLVAAGTTNAKIAEELFLSDRTVQDHISNALRKLGLSGRAGLAAWAARQGLV